MTIFSQTFIRCSSCSRWILVILLVSHLSLSACYSTPAAEPLATIVNHDVSVISSPIFSFTADISQFSKMALEFNTTSLYSLGASSDHSRGSRRTNLFAESTPPPFQCVPLSASAKFDPTIFCSGVVDYDFILPAGLTVEDFNKMAKAAGASALNALSTPCLSDIKKLICSRFYMPCAPNVIPLDYSTYIMNDGVIPLPMKRPCKNICLATTGQGISCGGILEAVGAGFNCDEVDATTTLPVFDASNNPQQCNDFAAFQGKMIIGSKNEPYVGEVCRGVIPINQNIYIPPGNMLDKSGSLSTLLPPFVVQSILEDILVKVEATVPRYFTSECLLAQRQYACSMAFMSGHKVTELGPAFDDFYLPSYPHQEVCSNYLDKCSKAIGMIPALGANCSVSAGPGLKQFPDTPQTILLLPVGPGVVLDLKTPPTRLVLEGATLHIATECPYATLVPLDEFRSRSKFIAATECALQCPPAIYSQDERDTLINNWISSAFVCMLFVLLACTNIYFLAPKKRNIYISFFVVGELIHEIFNLIQVFVVLANRTDADDTLAETICSSPTSWISRHFPMESPSASICVANGFVLIAFQSFSYATLICVSIELWLRVYWGMKDISRPRYFYASGGLIFFVVNFTMALYPADSDVLSPGYPFAFCSWLPQENKEFLLNAYFVPQMVILFISAVSFIHVLYVCIKISLSVQVKGENLLKKIWKQYRLMILFSISNFTIFPIFLFVLNYYYAYKMNVTYLDAIVEHTQCLFQRFTMARDTTYLSDCGAEPSSKHPVAMMLIMNWVFAMISVFCFAMMLTPEVEARWLQLIPQSIRSQMGSFGKISRPKRDSIISSNSIEHAEDKAIAAPGAPSSLVKNVVSAIAKSHAKIAPQDGEGSDQGTARGGSASEGSLSDQQGNSGQIGQALTSIELSSLAGAANAAELVSFASTNPLPPVILPPNYAHRVECVTPPDHGKYAEATDSMPV